MLIKIHSLFYLVYAWTFEWCIFKSHYPRVKVCTVRKHQPTWAQCIYCLTVWSGELQAGSESILQRQLASADKKVSNCRKLSEEWSVNLLWHIKCSTFKFYFIFFPFFLCRWSFRATPFYLDNVFLIFCCVIFPCVGESSELIWDND